MKIEDQEMIEALSDTINGEVFSYLGSIKKLEKQFENTSGGYYNHFSVYSENVEILYSFGYSGNYKGYIVSRNSCFYRLEKNDELDKICDEVIELAKEQIE